MTSHQELGQERALGVAGVSIGSGRDASFSRYSCSSPARWWHLATADRALAKFWVLALVMYSAVRVVLVCEVQAVGKVLYKCFVGNLGE
jgi:hypothetical protein